MYIVIKVHSVQKLYIICLISFTHWNNAHVTFSYHIFSSIPAVVGTLGKFPNQHLFGQNSTFQLSNYRPQLKFRFLPSCQSNLFLVTKLVLAIGKISPLAPFYTASIHFMYGQMGNFPLFPSLFGMLAIKAMAFCKISPFALFCATIYVLCIVKMGNFYYFFFCLTCWP